MFQNIGEVISYLGVFIFIIPLVIGLAEKIARFFGRSFATHKLGVVIIVMIPAGLIMFFCGDSYRTKISPDVMLSYYEQDLKYNELTDKQKINILFAQIDLPQNFKQGKDVSKYLPALIEYSYQEKIAEGHTPEEAKKETEYVIQKFK